jgi:hypothetical protein
MGLEKDLGLSMRETTLSRLLINLGIMQLDWRSDFRVNINVPCQEHSVDTSAFFQRFPSADDLRCDWNWFG